VRRTAGRGARASHRRPVEDLIFPCGAARLRGTRARAAGRRPSAVSFAARDIGKKRPRGAFKSLLPRRRVAAAAAKVAAHRSQSQRRAPRPVRGGSGTAGTGVTRRGSEALAGTGTCVEGATAENGVASNHCRPEAFSAGPHLRRFPGRAWPAKSNRAAVAAPKPFPPAGSAFVHGRARVDGRPGF